MHSLLRYMLLIFFSPLLHAQGLAERENAALNEILANPLPITQLTGKQSVTTLFTIHGSNTVGESLAPTLVMNYLREKGAVNLRIQSLANANEKVVKGDLINIGKTIQVLIAAHGSSTGFASLVNGDAQIWASSRRVKPSEVNQVAEQYNLTAPTSEHVLAIDGLAMVVNPSNPINALSKEQLALIFSGAITNWSQVGGKPGLIQLYARDENSGTWDSFKNLVLQGNVKLSDASLRYESSEALVNQVIHDPQGIGFIGLAFVGKSKLLAVSDGGAPAFQPSFLTVATEDYALSRRLYFYTQGTLNNQYVDEFIRYSEAINGQKIVAQQGFISQNVDAINTQLAEHLPTDYLELVNGNKRLSVNFRFNEGSAKLDNKARKDIQRLVYFMGQQSADKKIRLIGFGDKHKNQERSKLLSKLRAMAVRRELARYGVYPDTTTGYGEFNPVATFNGASGIKNSRVEVWLR